MFRHYFYAGSTIVFSYIFIFLVVLPAMANGEALSSLSASVPALQLANHYHQEIEIQNYWVSEKLDGVRAYWDGSKLVSKKGHRYYAPAWFTAGFPDFPLDGELWLARNSFDKLSGIVRKKQAIDDEWRQVSYQIFDLPESTGNFDNRLAFLRDFFDQSTLPAWLQLIEQFKVKSHDELMARLDKVVKLGAEGLMLHLGSSFYHAHRDDELLKLKRYFDAEAKVISYLPGKGKYQGVLGSMLVEMQGESHEAIRFRIGSGFSDKQRQSPPPLGAIITYKYFGVTQKGLPRFASFLRIREAL